MSANESPAPDAISPLIGCHTETSSEPDLPSQPAETQFQATVSRAGQDVNIFPFKWKQK